MGILDGGLSFDGVDESSTGDYPPVPDGQYSIEAVKFESKTYGSGNEGVDIQFSIMGPTHQNRKVFETFVLTGKNPQVALGRMKAFMRSAGIDVDTVPLNQQTLSQAMNTPVQANIYTQAGTNGYPAKNQIKSFLAPQAQAQAPQAQAPQAQAQAPAPQANQPTGQQVNWQD
tara:strand:+ start:1491 stop:2006 length:516 start_codon:yes stop_codon:yes gene_type:complete